MAECDTKPAAPSAEYCEFVAFSLLDVFIDLLAEEERKGKGPITVQHARALVQAMKTGERDKAIPFLEMCSACLRQHEQDIWDRARRRPFDRVLVKRFSHLLPVEGGLDRGEGVVSRRALPGLFMAVEMMVGPQLFEQCQQACRALVEARRKKHGGSLNWQEIYDDPRAGELLSDAMAVMTPHFHDFEKRFEWLDDVINSHLAPAEDYAFEGEAVVNWTLDRHALAELLKALFKPLSLQLADAAGRNRITQRYGERTTTALEHLTARLNAVG